MLASLTIKNIVLIDQLTINFSDGLCALTGETGAGKSILLDSLGLVLGARADSGLVRQGTDQASVTVVFDLPKKHPVFSFLKEQDLEIDDGSLILRRSLKKDGGSKAFINDQAVSASFLKQLGSLLVEIHGQFDTQSLLNPQYHIDLLDEYAGNQKLLSEVKNKWQEWQKKQRELVDIRVQIEKARTDEDFYRSSLEDLDALSPEAGEEEKLSMLRERLMRREQILESLNSAEKGLQDIEETSGVVWRSLERLGEEGKDASVAMGRVSAELQEVLAAVNDLSSDVMNSEYSLQEIDDRLFALKGQARKHQCTIDDLQKKRDEIAEALNSIENQDNVLADLMQLVEKKKIFYQQTASKLSRSRLDAGQKLSKLISKELPPLKLDKASFEVSIDDLTEDNWNERGIDKVQFLVATNPGSVAGPLNKIVSGGEMSRFMLALKVVLAEVGAAGTLVFDEVDSGVGGATAAAVGERLAQLSNKCQVLVVTHSPQVAARAKHHWIVSKDGKDTVKTDIVPLYETPQRKEEIARMISGSEITEEARAAAGKLLEASAA